MSSNLHYVKKVRCASILMATAYSNSIYATSQRLVKLKLGDGPSLSGRAAAVREAVTRHIAKARREAESRRHEAQQLSTVKPLSQIPSCEECALSSTIQLSCDTVRKDVERRVARRLARWELNDRLALEASKMDEVWRSLLSQLLTGSSSCRRSRCCCSGRCGCARVADRRGAPRLAAGPGCRPTCSASSCEEEQCESETVGGRCV